MISVWSGKKVDMHTVEHNVVCLLLYLLLVPLFKEPPHLLSKNMEHHKQDESSNTINSITSKAIPTCPHRIPKPIAPIPS